jgi:hypothetical protein
MQRRAEDQLAKEVEKRNEQLTAEDREKNLRWMVVGRRGEKRMVKGTEREQQNYGRREVQLGDYIQQQQRGYRNEYETGARRKEYFQQQRQQQAPTLGGPTLLAPIQQNNHSYVPVQHNSQQQNYGGWQQREQQYQQHQPQYTGTNRPGQYNTSGGGTAVGNNGGNGGRNHGASGGARSGPGPVQYGPGFNSGPGAGGYNRQEGAAYNNSGSNSGNNSGGTQTIGDNNGCYNGNYGANGPMNVQLQWRGGPSNNDSGYTEPNWQEQGRGNGGGEWQGNTQQRIPDRQTTAAADTYGNTDGTRPRLNSKRGRDGPGQPTEDGPPRTRLRQ